jgi:hypothetical protein
MKTFFAPDQEKLVRDIKRRLVFENFARNMVSHITRAAFSRVILASTLNHRTPFTFHFAAHSTFQVSLALPPKGETRPSNRSPAVYSTLRTFLHRRNRVAIKISCFSGDHLATLRTNDMDREPASFLTEPDTSLYIERIVSAALSASYITSSILPFQVELTCPVVLWRKTCVGYSHF